MRQSMVYKYTNVINNKVYIGRTSQTIRARAGKNGNGYRTCSRFWNAICKYGWNNFKLEIIAENLSFEESVELEKSLIENYKSFDSNFGYNILEQEPGEGCLTEEVRKKISISHTGLKKGMHKREKRNENKERTEEHRKHLSESLKGITPWNKGLKTGPLKEETRQKMSEIRKNNTNSIHVFVKNLETGEIFRSGAEAGRSIGCTSEAIFAAIKENRPCKGYMFARVYEQCLTTIESGACQRVE